MSATINHMGAECAGDHIGREGHEREAMTWVTHNRVFQCPRCGFKGTDEQVRRAVPSAYRPSGKPMIIAFQAMLDYRLVVIFGRWGQTVEYPRPSLDSGPVSTDPLQRDLAVARKLNEAKGGKP